MHQNGQNLYFTAKWSLHRHQWLVEVSIKTRCCLDLCSRIIVQSLYGSQLHDWTAVFTSLTLFIQSQANLEGFTTKCSGYWWRATNFGANVCKQASLFPSNLTFLQFQSISNFLLGFKEERWWRSELLLKFLHKSFSLVVFYTACSFYICFSSRLN